MLLDKISFSLFSKVPECWVNLSFTVAICHTRKLSVMLFLKLTMSTNVLELNTKQFGTKYFFKRFYVFLHIYATEFTFTLCLFSVNNQFCKISTLILIQNKNKKHVSVCLITFGSVKALQFLAHFVIILFCMYFGTQ